MYNEVLEKTLITEEQIQKRVTELAKQIENDYAGKAPVIVGVLKGSVLFYTDLIRQIDLPLTVDFMSISSYGAGVNSSGEVKIIKDIDGKIGGKDVIIVEDIVDSGYSMNCLLKLFGTRSPKSVKVCLVYRKNTVYLLMVSGSRLLTERHLRVTIRPMANYWQSVHRRQMQILILL